MNAPQFETELNRVIVAGLQSIDAKELQPSAMIFALEVQKSQLINLFVQMAIKAQQQSAPIIIPRPNSNGRQSL